MFRKGNACENLTLIALDMDNLKKINDTQGHSRGDAYIKVFGSMLKKVFREYGGVYRTGGDEFIVLLKKVESGQLVEVVRCDVCKNAESYDCTIHGTVHHLYKCKKDEGAIGYNKVVSSNDFCSCGKRKGGDGNE